MQISLPHKCSLEISNLFYKPIELTIIFIPFLYLYFAAANLNGYNSIYKFMLEASIYLCTDQDELQDSP